jgi:SAM-dependent methyltransferase
MGAPLRQQKSLNEASRTSLASVDLIHGDMEQSQIPEGHYDLIMCIQYLQRTLFPRLASALRPGGVLLVETYTRAQLDFADGPHNPAYLLETGELREAFPELCVLFYRELRAGQGIASLLARK